VKQRTRTAPRGCSFIPCFLALLVRHLTIAMAASILAPDPIVELRLRACDYHYGMGKLNTPTDVQVADIDDERDCIVVADVEESCIHVFSSDGRFMHCFGEPGNGTGQFDGCFNVAINHEEGHVYVADAFNHRVQTFDLASGKFQDEFGSEGDAFGEVGASHGIAYDRDRRLLVVAEYNNNRVQLFTPDGQPCLMFGTSGSGDGEFQSPQYVAIDQPTRRIVVSDLDNMRLQVFTADGEFLLAIGREGTQAGEFKSPNGMCITREFQYQQHQRHNDNDHDNYHDDDGALVLVADSELNRIQAFTLSGRFVSMLELGGTDALRSPESVAVDSRGRILIADSGNRRVVVVGAGRWLSLGWRVDRHAHMPASVRIVVYTMTLIRSLEPSLSVSLLPNELLFEIFQFL